MSAEKAIVKKSNALSRARWSAQSVLEPRFVALLASRINVNDEDFKVYEIHISELGRYDSGRDYDEVAQAVDNTMSRVITIPEPDGWVKYNVFSRCRFRRKEGILELGFHPDLKPHYLQLKSNFAQYNLFEFLKLSSVYSQRMFEFLKSWDDKPEVLVDIKELHEMIDAPVSLRKNFKDFRRRVLEKAQLDIHKFTALRYEWEIVKKGNKVDAIKFIFSRGKKAAIEAKRTSADKEKDAKRNNDLFLEMIACHKKHTDKVCPHVEKSKKCLLCKMNFPK